MENGMLLNVLYGEWQREMGEQTLHVDDIRAIERVGELLAREMPRKEDKND